MKEKGFFDEGWKNFPEPTEEEKRKIHEEWEKLPKEEQDRRNIIMNILMEYYEALHKKDWIKAAKQIGKLELIDPDNSDFYSGQIRELEEDYSGAIEDFKNVKAQSERYNDAILHLENSFMMSGDYLGLNELYKTADFSDINKVEHRINCLIRMKDEQFEEKKEEIRQIPFETIDSMARTEENMHSFHWICRMLAVLLSVSGEMISECYNYQLWVGKEIENFDIDPNVSENVKTYNRFVLILQKSEAIKILKAKNGENFSLAKWALSDYSWPEKLKLFSENNYVRTVAEIIATLLNPRNHPADDPYSLVHELMDHFAWIRPEYIQAVINEAFEIVSTAAKSGDESAVFYLSFALADVLATKKDEYQIKDRVKQVLDEIPNYNNQDVIDRRKLVTVLSPTAYEALKNAEGAYQATSRSKFHVGDASPLGLMYFRILEIEYNEKFVVPFANLINIEELEGLCGRGKEISDRTEDELRNEDRWGKDIDLLNDIRSGGRTSIELGSTRVILDHIRAQYGTCGMKMYTALYELLTEEGKDAFIYGPMISLISSTKVKKFRNPGAHSGYLPYSEACKARDIVLGNVHLISSWFKKGIHSSSE